MCSIPTQMALVSSTTSGNDGGMGSSDSDSGESLHSKRTDNDTEESDDESRLRENCRCGRSLFLSMPEVRASKKRKGPRVHYFKCSFCGTKYKRQAIYNRHTRTKLHKKNMSECLLDELSSSNESINILDEDDEQTVPVNLSQEANEPTPGPSAIALEREEKKEPEAEAEQK